MILLFDHKHAVEPDNIIFSAPEFRGEEPNEKEI